MQPLEPVDFTEERTYAATRRPVELAGTLLPAAYSSPEFFSLERERVFASGWVAVACLADIDRPGACRVVEVAGRSIIITRNRHGVLRAFQNVCRHRGTMLLTDDATEVGRGDRIRCPYHAWAYDLDGACLGTPLFEGSDIPAGEEAVFARSGGTSGQEGADASGAKAFDRADLGLLEVAVDSWALFVFVCLDADPVPLATQLGDLPQRFAGYRLDEWVPRRRRTYEVAANYKLVGENFMEYYHLPWVHPELTKVSKFSDHYRWQGAGMYSGMCTTPVSRNGDAGGWDGLPALAGLDASDAVSGRFVWLFPSTALVVLPNHAFVLFNRPVGPSVTVETAILFAHPESLEAPDAEDGLDQLEAFWDLVNSQDLEIAERVQKGVSNPAYTGGRMCFRFEEPLHRFQNMVIDRMVGIDRIPPGDDQTAVRMFPDVEGV